MLLLIEVVVRLVEERGVAAGLWNKHIQIFIITQTCVIFNNRPDKEVVS